MNSSASMTPMFLVMCSAILFLTSCATRKLNAELQNEASKNVSEPAPSQILGRMPWSEAQSVQLGMTMLYPDPKARATYTAAMMPAVNRAVRAIQSGKPYSEIIEAIAAESLKVNRDLPESKRFGQFRYDPKAYHPELIEIFGSAFADQPFGTAVLKEERHYGLMIPFLDEVRSQFATGEPSAPVVQHFTAITIRGLTRTIPGTRIEYIKDRRQLNYARLVHADPAQRKALGFETDDALRTWVREYQDGLLESLKSSAKSAPKTERSSSPDPIETCARITYLELTSVFYSRGSSGLAVAFLLACLRSQGWEFTAFRELPDFLAFGLPFDGFFERLRSGQAFL